MQINLGKGLNCPGMVIENRCLFLFLYCLSLFRLCKGQLYSVASLWSCRTGAGMDIMDGHNESMPTNMVASQFSFPEGFEPSARDLAVMFGH